MKPYYEEAGIQIFCGDCREILPQLGPVDVVITDPPYGNGTAYASYEDSRDNLRGLINSIQRGLINKAQRVAVTCGVKNITL